VYFVFSFHRMKLTFYIVIVILLTASVIVLINSKWFLRLLYPLHFEEIIFKYSEFYDLDPYLVAAIIKVESKFLPGAISSKGARGLMQIMPETGRWAAEQMGLEEFSPGDLFDPETNIKIGTWYLNQLRREFNNDIDLVLAAYNGGRGNVRKWMQKKQLSFGAKNIENIPCEEKKQFVIRVKKTYRNYKRIYN